jgi:hypothetical protein
MLTSTTGEAAVEQATPLTMAVPTAPQALLTGMVGVGDGELGEELLLPPHATQTSGAARTAAAIRPDEIDVAAMRLT